MIYGQKDKNCRASTIKYKDCGCYLEYGNVKDDLIEYKCWCCNNNYQKELNENLKKDFVHTYKFTNHNVLINLFYCCEKVFTHMNTFLGKTWLRKIWQNIINRQRRSL